MKDYDTSWVPKGHVLTVSKRKFYLSRFLDEDVERYCAHLASPTELDPFNLRFEFLGNFTTKVVGPGFWGSLMGQQSTTTEVFTRLEVGKDIPTDAHVVNAFDRLRKSYDEVKALLDSESEILGTYPPKTVKVS